MNDGCKHPDATRARVLALAAAIDGLPEYVNFTSGQDEAAWARLVDTLDSLAWLDPSQVERYVVSDGRPFEQITVSWLAEEKLVLCGPIGFTPVSDRLGLQRASAEKAKLPGDEPAPTERLAARHLAEDAVVVPFPTRAEDDAPLGAA